MPECENCYGRVLPIKLRRYGTSEPPMYVCAVCGPIDKPTPADLAIEIPMDDCGLHVNTGRDGSWLHFDDGMGGGCSMNVNIMAEKDGVFGRALRAWCADRRKQADKIRADNGQFGFGA